MTPVLLLLATTVAAPGGKDAEKAPDALVGEWVAESLVKGGKPAKVQEGTGMTFAPGGKAVLAERGKGVDATYTTDPKKDPPHIDLMVPGPDGGKGKGLSGVYRLDGDTLTLCFGPEGDRPAGFDSPAGSKLMLMVLKRKKKE